jgi:hypothetical protein
MATIVGFDPYMMAGGVFPASFYDGTATTVSGISANTASAKSGFPRCAKFDASAANAIFEKLLDNTKTDYVTQFEMMVPSSIPSGLNFQRYQLLCNNGAAVYVYVRTGATGYTVHFLVWNTASFIVDYDDPTVYPYDVYQRFDLRVLNIGTTTWTVELKVDGTSLYNAPVTNTATTLFSHGPNMNDIFSGNISYFQTWVWSYTAADYPLGPFNGRRYLVDAVGTHNLDATPSSFYSKMISAVRTFLTSSETTSYLALDDEPISADSDAIRIDPATGGPPNTPTFRAAGTVAASANNVANGAFPTGPGAPAGKAVGDMLVLVISSTHNAFTVTTPTGWTLATSKASGTALGGKVFVYTRIADGTAADTPNPVLAGLTTSTTGTPAQAVILAFTNLTETQDAAAVSSDLAAQTTTTAIPSITTTVDKDMVIGIAIKMGETSGQTSTVATFTERVDVSTTSGTGYIMEVSTLVKTPAGATGTATVTWSATGSQRALAVTLSFKATLSTTSPAATTYAEYTFGDEGTITAIPAMVCALISKSVTTAVASTFVTKLRDTVAAAEEDIFNGSISNTTKNYSEKFFAQRPNTGGAWTIAALNGLRLRFGYSAAVDGGPRLETAMIVAIFPAATSALTNISLNAGLTMTATPVRLPLKTIPVAMTVAPVLSFRRTRFLSVISSLSATSALARSLFRAMPVGLTMTPALLASKLKFLALSASLVNTPAITFVRKRFLAPAGALTMTPVISRVTGRFLSAGLTMTPAQSARATHLRTLAATLTASATLSRLLFRPQSVSLTMAPAFSLQKFKGISLPATLTMASTVVRMPLRVISVGLTMAGALNRKLFRAIPLTMTATPSLTAQKSKFLTIPASLTLTPVISLRVTKLQTLAAGLTLTGVVGKLSLRPLSASLTLSPAQALRLTRLRTLAATGAFTASLTTAKSTARSLAASVTLTPVITQKAGKALFLNPSMVMSAATTKLVLKSLPVSPSMNLLITQRRQYSRTLAASMVISTVLTKSKFTTRLLSAGLGVTPTLQRQYAAVRVLAAVMNSTVALKNLQKKNLAASLVATPALVITRFAILATGITLNASVTSLKGGGRFISLAASMVLHPVLSVKKFIFGDETHVSTLPAESRILSAGSEQARITSTEHEQSTIGGA